MEEAFKAPAIHIPLGQCSDSAHLPNERISAHNLEQGKQVIKHLLKSIASR
jgi:di- and tripeptidase